MQSVQPEVDASDAMSTATTWENVPAGAVILGGDGARWVVERIGLSDASTPLYGVTMHREGQSDSVTGNVPPSRPVEVIEWPKRTPFDFSSRDAVRNLHAAGIATETIECGWCGASDMADMPDEDCVCDTWCGTSICINFRTSL